MTSRTVALAVLLVAVGVAWYRFRPGVGIVEIDVQPSYWRAQRRIPLGTVVASTGPRVLRETAIHQQWRQWALDDMEDSFLLRQVLRSPTPLIRLFRHDIETHQYPRITVNEEFQDVTVANVRAHHKDPATHGYDYVVIAPPKTLGPISTVLEMGLFGMRDDLAEDDFVTMAHVLCPNLTVQAHSEQDEHVYLVTRGYLHVLLLPPTVHEQLALFPYIHPYYGRSQLDLSPTASPEDQQIIRPLVAKEGLERVLGPGDLLFVPAHWFEHLTALDHAGAVNFVSVRTRIATGYTHIPRLMDLYPGTPPAMQALGASAMPLFHSLIIERVLERFFDGDAQPHVLSYFEQHYGRLVRDGHSVASDSSLEKLCAPSERKMHRTENDDELEKISDIYYRTLNRTKELDDEGTPFRVALFIDAISWKSVNQKHRRVPAFLSYCFAAMDPVQLAQLTKHAPANDTKP